MLSVEHLMKRADCVCTISGTMQCSKTRFCYSLVLRGKSFFTLMDIANFLMAYGRVHVGAGDDDQAVVVVERDSGLQDWASVRTQLALPMLKQRAK